MMQLLHLATAQVYPVPLAEFYQHSTEDTSVFYCEFQSGDRDDISTQFQPWTTQFRRWGEARHPGPGLLASFQCSDDYDHMSVVRFGCSNPSGLRRKEPLVIEHGPGVWGYSETQLSAITKKTTSGILKSLASQMNRHLRVHTGADVRPRISSEWAGSWSGTLVTSDFPSQVVQMPWPNDVYNSGRVLTTRHVINGLPVLHTTIYGFAKGPTWPKAHALTER